MSDFFKPKKKMPSNGRNILINCKDKSDNETLKLGFYAEFQMINTDANSECSDSIGGEHYLQQGWYETLFNDSKSDCKKLVDLEVVDWTEFKADTNKEITYDDYIELCVVSGASSHKETDNWLNHYWVLDSDRENIKL